MNKVEKMEQALDLALSLLDLKEGEASKTIRQQDIDAIKAARAMPKRNCDVGTEEEQKDRFKAYCDMHFDYLKHGCKKCPARDYINGWGAPYCQLKWAQMPYTEGGANEK